MKIGWTKYEKYNEATFPPQEEDTYLITTTTGRLSLARWTNIYFFGHAIKSDWHWENSMPYESTLAWMPLPQAFIDSKDEE